MTAGDVHLHDPQTLYRHWEDAQWNPFAIDQREGLLPGFVDGYGRIHHDEQRHIGYGVWYLPDAVGRDASLAGEVRATLGRLLPAVAESLTPPDRDGTDWDALGASAQEVRKFALDGLTRRLKIIGVELS